MRYSSSNLRFNFSVRTCELGLGSFIFVFFTCEILHKSVHVYYFFNYRTDITGVRDQSRVKYCNCTYNLFMVEEDYVYVHAREIIRL
jgi:uncharacterized membrane protein YhfC